MSATMIDPATEGHPDQFEWTEADVAAVRDKFSEMAGVQFRRTGRIDQDALVQSPDPISIRFHDGEVRQLLPSYAAAMVQKFCAENGDPSGG